ncbi:hypothetical protein [Sulfitobacter sp. 20_GPM-1509m]|uniref:hypothetical protein n=1 Tax=Sulfitobacter sp. 20_GPM-1509m TaxID=1380367 RepID=UPI0012DD6633|nr:hypothetical protein [Sulfitobacter sp. 20_GPM-1509m]
MTKPTQTTARNALEAIRLFESAGRTVSGVTIKGREYTIALVTPTERDIPDADLVDMSK